MAPSARVRAGKSATKQMTLASRPNSVCASATQLIGVATACPCPKLDGLKDDLFGATTQAEKRALRALINRFELEPKL